MFTSVPKSRLLLYFVLLGLLPIVLAFFHLMSKRSEVAALNSNVQYTYEMAALREKRQAANMAVREHFKTNDLFYIDKNIESLTLLEPEVESLQKILSQNNFVENDVLKKRLEFLTGSNKIAFSEGVVQTYPYFRETTETLIHPVEIDVSDLEELLAKIEGVTIGPFAPGPNRPQLIITDFKLDRTKSGEKSEVFGLNLKLIKREFF